MLTRRLPNHEPIARFIERQRSTPLSYTSLENLTIDHNRIRLGTGADVFARAVAALTAWRMFDVGWVTLCWPDTPITVGSVVAIAVPLYGIWSLNACRVVDVFDEDDGVVRRRGFAYGTLADHVESGQERFTIEWHHRDGAVWYDLHAHSRLRHVLARIAYPLSRRLQRRFARDSLQAMRRAVAP